MTDDLLTYIIALQTVHLGWIIGRDIGKIAFNPILRAKRAKGNLND